MIEVIRFWASSEMREAYSCSQTLGIREIRQKQVLFDVEQTLFRTL